MASVDRFMDDYCVTFGDAEVELDWTVYHVEPRQGWSDHHSLYMACEGDMGLIIEPNVRTAHGGKDSPTCTVATKTLFFNPKIHGSLTKMRLGCTRMSGSNIIHVVTATARQMGNNCTEAVS